MFKVLKVVLLSLVLVGYFNVINGQERGINKSKPVVVSKKVVQKLDPSAVPKRVVLSDEYINVNSRDTIFVETIQFPLMSDVEKVFVMKRITDYRSSKIKLFIDSFSNRVRFQDEDFQDINYFQKWRFVIVYQSQTELSIKLHNYEFTGGTHGNTTLKSFNIDLKNLKGYKFIEKFPNLSVDKVAEYCTNYCISKKIPIFDNKIKPAAELFNIWNFTNEGLLITFQQYSIAPYSSGIIEIHIPKKELEKLTIND
jgi:hypothetical protein